MKELIKTLNAERNEKQERIRRIDEAIKVLQQICDHIMIEIGTDSHKTHYKCSVCGKQESI